MKAHMILINHYHKTITNASARLSETEARALVKARVTLR